MKPSKQSIDLDWVRRQVVTAFAADDDLSELLVLKGGNALRLVHQIGKRASLDLDYSVAESLDEETVKEAIGQALNNQFRRDGYAVFDVAIEKKPRLPEDRQDIRPTWGGWRVTFKLIRHESLMEGAAIDKLRMQAFALYEKKKDFRIDISGHEYVDAAVFVTFEGFDVRVYSLSMIVYEKLRALCQQMKGYEPVAHPSPRPRDFVDICSILERAEKTVFADRNLLKKVFAAKDVPLQFLLRIESTADFHEGGWPAVRAELGADAGDFDSYVARVLRFVSRLEAAGVVDAPA